MFVSFVKSTFQESHAWVLYILEYKCIHIYVVKLSKKLDINTQPVGMKLCLSMVMGCVGGRGQILTLCSLHAPWSFVNTTYEINSEANIQYSQSLDCCDVIARDWSPYHWPFVQGIHRQGYPPNFSNTGLKCFLSFASLNKFLNKQSGAKHNVCDSTHNINPDISLKSIRFAYNF